MVDEGTEFGARVARHLRDDIVVWMTTVTPAGRPVPMPVWFLWDGDESVRRYSRRTPRLRNIEANRDHIARLGMTPATFAQSYEMPVQIRVRGVRGH